MTTVPVAWAVRGKESGSYADYGITAGGRGLSARQLPAVFDELSSLGEPPVERAGPRALPWIVFTAVRAGDRDHVGLAVQEWTDQSDAMGRPITTCTFYYLPYRDAGDLGVSYRELLAAVQDEPLPQDGSALNAPLTGTDPRYLADTIADQGFARVAGAAALLLEGPVTVTRAEHLTVEERLAFMDAVAALLPQGWRTRFSAATWHEGTDLRIGLVFGQVCRPGSFELDWQAPGAPRASTAAAAYHTWLYELVETRGWPGARLVAALAAQRGSMFHAGPGAAVEIVADLDWPGTVWRAVLDGTAQRADLVRLFTGGRHRELDDPGKVARVFGALVDVAEPDDLPLVAKLWHECGGEDGTLLRNARRRLWRERPQPDLGAYVETADRLGFADGFVAGLLAEPHPPGERPGGEATLAALLRERRPPGPGRTAEALARNGSVLAELLLAVTPDPIAERRAWLQTVVLDAPPVLLDAFDGLWSRPSRVPDTWPELVQNGRRCVPAVLHAAAKTPQALGDALAAFGRWLMTDADPAHAPFWAEALARLDASTSAEKGTIDGLLAWLGDNPRHFADCTRSPNYFEAFHAVCADPAGQRHRPRLVEALAAFVSRYEWIPAGHTAAIVKLVDRFAADREVGSALLFARSVEPTLVHVNAYGAWRRRYLDARQELRKVESLLLIRNVRPDAPPDVVGELCAEALHEGHPFDWVRDEILEAGWRFTPDQFVSLLDTVTDTLTRLGRGRDEAEDSALKLGRLLMLRRPQEETAQIRRYTVRYAVLEIRYRLNMIRYLGGDPERKGKLLLDGAVRKELDRLGTLAGRVAKSGAAPWRKG
ncbi:hypothetical protein BZB76_1116 [Actinomadura pelletieri DSM 43383]|uniref:Uncharacterized protein n=1 Tax=Actinomadura pelletieri DSM 43383 TaxID=1120940 RepID=A0A495QZJ5_9ACTN|nr:hypothetical protein [Actinomadura pelletieri]RKS79641.1 hypothetical protein BZB76_1116 [Actinomadura pelletieri DSM 43383]